MPPSPFNLETLHIDILPKSITVAEQCEFGLVRIGNQHDLMILGRSEDVNSLGFEGKASEVGQMVALQCHLNHHNASTIRKVLPWLKPIPLGLKTSAGMGDRLGYATPGHVRAIQKTDGNIAPIFAQQSIREMARTTRTPDQVMDDATWGIFQENWQNGVGADADHLKTTEDIDVCLAAGFTFFTIDPGNFVDNKAETASTGELNEIVLRLPNEIQIEENGLLNKKIHLDELHLEFSEAVLLKAMVKYGKAIWHVKTMYDHLLQVAGNRPFELEVSVDETDLPTSHAEHFYIACELKRLGVKWVSLAPRYVGRFEKGVDYIGDLAAFERDIKGHASIARHVGPYKLSLHSGSDKFRIYPLVNEYTQGLVHLKTAGTSYLEALSTIAEIDKNLIKEIYQYARDHYETDRASYHVSAMLEKAPKAEVVSDWSGLIQQFDAREIFHVTFGSVLTQKNSDGSFLFFDRIIDILKQYPDAYAQHIENHFIRHLRPFCAP